MMLTLCHVTKRGLSTDPLPPLLVHIVIEWPLSGILAISSKTFNATSAKNVVKLKMTGMYCLYIGLEAGAPIVI